MNIWDKLQKLECRCVNRSLETLLHCLNVVTLSLFCRYVFGKCSSELAELFLLPHLSGRSTRYSNKLHDFSVTILGCFRYVYVSSFFLRTARLGFSACRMLYHKITCLTLTKVKNEKCFEAALFGKVRDNFRKQWKYQTIEKICSLFWFFFLLLSTIFHKKWRKGEFETYQPIAIF